MLSGAQIGADVGAGLPDPIGEGLAVIEEGLAAPGSGDSEGNRVCGFRATAMAPPKLRLAPVTSAVVPDSSCVGMRDPLDAYEAVIG